MQIVGASGAGLVALAAAWQASAQEKFPVRPIELIVPTPPRAAVLTSWPG